MRYVGEVSETSMDLVKLEWYGMALSFLSVPLPSRLRILVMVELSENEVKHYSIHDELTSI